MSPSVARSAKVDRMASQASFFGSAKAVLRSGVRATGPCREGGPQNPAQFSNNQTQPQLALSHLATFTFARSLRNWTARLMPFKPRGFREAVCVHPPESVDAEALLHRVDLKCGGASGRP